VLKLQNGSSGEGVMLIESARALRSALDTFKALETTIVLQEFVRVDPVRDVRVLVIGGRAVAAMERARSRSIWRPRSWSTSRRSCGRGGER
jgi:ribosomal protein S6--L-glutamate ligase